MADQVKPDQSPLAASSRPASGGLSPGEFVGALAGLVWVAGTGMFLLVRSGAEDTASLGALAVPLSLMAVFLPVTLIWVAVAASRSGRIMREESARLQAAVDALRKAHVEDRQSRGAGGDQASVERKLNEIAQSARKTESVLASFTSSRTAATISEPAAGGAAPAGSAAATGPEEQPALAFGTPAEDTTPRVSVPDLIRALNFPDTEGDQEGFAALRRALKDRRARQLIQASQDMLTLLSQDGIYMDDLVPDLARPEIWRRFAQGERGRTIAPLGGVRDRSSLALTAARMREDTIFRDAAHHFLRRFDQMLEDFEGSASDEEIVAMSDTRTARAFMLLGRVTGTFD